MENIKAKCKESLEKNEFELVKNKKYESVKKNKIENVDGKQKKRTEMET